MVTSYSTVSIVTERCGLWLPATALLVLTVHTKTISQIVAAATDMELWLSYVVFMCSPVMFLF